MTIQTRPAVGGNARPLSGALFCIAALAVVFCVHSRFLSLGFSGDDLWFMGAAGSPPMYAVTDSSPAAFMNYFSPWHGWFFRPVTLCYLGAMYALFGPSATVYHAGSLLLHAGAVILLGALAARLTGRESARWIAGAFFVLWPGKDEAVWWIASVSTLLCTCFYLGAIHLFLSFQQSRHRVLFLGAMLCCIVSLLSKSDAVSIACTLAIIGYQCRARDVMPFAALTAAFCACEFIAGRHYAAQMGEAEAAIAAQGLTDRVLSIILAVRNQVDLGLPLLALLGLMFAAVSQVQSRPERCVFQIGAWWACTAVTMPLLCGMHATAERFLYLPIAALAVGAGCALSVLWHPAPVAFRLAYGDSDASRATSVGERA